jgi:hypothetical protein
LSIAIGLFCDPAYFRRIPRMLTKKLEKTV